MKQIRFVRMLAVVLCTCSSSLFAQNENEALTNVQTPSSPAAAIIGNQPATISRPKSWESLETSLFSNFLDSTNKFMVPNNYALEFSPYWASRSKKLTNENYLAPRPGLSMLQNLSVSLSSTNNYVLNDSIKTNAIGIGLRTMIWQGTKTEMDSIGLVYKQLLVSLGTSNNIFMLSDNQDYPSPCTKEAYIDTLIKAITAKKSSVLKGMDERSQLTWIKSFRTYLEENLPGGIDYSVDTNRDTITSLTDNYIRIGSTLESIESLRKNRKGFKLELATAVALNFPTNRVDYSYGSKAGIWITPSFQPFKKQYRWIEFSGVLRYFWYNENFSNMYLDKGSYYENNFDYGFKTAFRFNKLSFDMEGTGRRSGVVIYRITEPDGSVITKTNHKSDTQYIATLSYQVNENISISYHFGKAFKPTISYHGGNLLSVTSINFGLGAPKVKDLQP